MTARNILVDSLKQTHLEQQKLEIVERKGHGHQNCIYDAIMDRISVRLSQVRAMVFRNQLNIEVLLLRESIHISQISKLEPLCAGQLCG